MVKKNSDALGIIFPNTYDEMVPDLVSVRSMASIPFASRYRMIDFILSSMANSGITNISIMVQNNYYSLMDHLGSGREWDLTRKNGGLHIIPPYAEKTVHMYTGRVQALESILGYLKKSSEKYVVLSDSNIAVNFDFKDFIREHEESNADISLAYMEEVATPEMFKDSTQPGANFYSLEVDEDGRVKKLYVNMKSDGVQKIGMNIYVIERTRLIDMVNTAYLRGYIYFERDILLQNVDRLNIHGYKSTRYALRVTSLKGYFENNMSLLDENNIEALFGPSPIYTKIRDDNPTRYIKGSNVHNVMAADGCVIEGEVENSVLFRGVKIGKGAVVKNCVLMQDTIVEPGATVEYVVSDKDVRISEGKELKGTDSFPVFIGKRQIV